jgi:hypothetical protein
MARKPAGGLTKWFKESWVDISRPKKGGGFEKCGRTKSGTKAYPKCLPAAKAARLTEAQRKSAIRRKRAAGNKGGKPTYVSTLVKRKKRGSSKKKR